MPREEEADDNLLLTRSHGRRHSAGTVLRRTLPAKAKKLLHSFNTVLYVCVIQYTDAHILISPAEKSASPSFNKRGSVESFSILD